MQTGYVFNFQRGAYSPEGKVEMTNEDIEAHNARLANDEWDAMLASGRGLLYFDSSTRTVSDWPGVHKLPVSRVATSWHNMAGRDGRTDVWFHLDGSVWHGVNIGDNQILRVKRSKS